MSKSYKLYVSVCIDDVEDIEELKKYCKKSKRSISQVVVDDILEGNKKRRANARG